VIVLNKEIDAFIKVSKIGGQSKITSFMNKEQILNELIDLSEELTLNEDEYDNDTDEDVDDDLKKRNSNDESRNNEPVDLIDLKLTFNTYLPCCAHNAQLNMKLN
jgi:hypothetical protein